MASSPFKEIERILERMGRQVEADLPVEMQRDVAVDVADHGDKYEVTMDVPGFEKEDIELTLADRTLRIEAKRHLEHEEYGETTGGETTGEESIGEETTGEDVPSGTVRVGEQPRGGVTYIRKERRRESISRSVEFPDPVDEERVEASLSNGVLTVTLPKISPEESARQIDID